MITILHPKKVRILKVGPKFYPQIYSFETREWQCFWFNSKEFSKPEIRVSFFSEEKASDYLDMAIRVNYLDKYSDQIVKEWYI